MKNIKLLLASLASLVLLVGCNDDEYKPADLYLADGASASLTVEPAGSEVTLAFVSTDQWAASTNSSWLSVSKTSGNAGTNQIVATADKNADLSGDRTGTVSVIAGDKKLIFTISQGQYAQVSYNLGEEKAVELPDLGGSANLVFTSNQDWSASADAEWVKLASASGTPGRANVLTVSAEVNDGEDREATVTVLCGTETVTFSVSQPATANELDYAAGQEQEMEIQPLGESKTLKFTSTRPWTASVDNDFLTLSATSGDRGEGEITIAAPTNRIGSRTAVVTVTSFDKTITFSVSQEASLLWLDEDANTVFEIDRTEQELEIAFNAAKDWTVETDADWLSLSVTSGAAGEGLSLTATVAANTTAEPRTASVVVTVEDQTAVFAINQDFFHFLAFMGSWTVTGTDSQGAYTEEWIIEPDPDKEGVAYLYGFSGEEGPIPVLWDSEMEAMAIPTGADYPVAAYNFNGIGPAVLCPMYKDPKYWWFTEGEDEFPIYAVMGEDGITLMGMGINAAGTAYTWYRNPSYALGLFEPVFDDEGNLTGVGEWMQRLYFMITPQSITRTPAASAAPRKLAPMVPGPKKNAISVNVAPADSRLSSGKAYRK